MTAVTATLALARTESPAAGPSSARWWPAAATLAVGCVLLVLVVDRARHDRLLPAEHAAPEPVALRTNVWSTTAPLTCADTAGAVVQDCRLDLVALDDDI